MPAPVPVKNSLVQDPSLVWRLADHEKFGYADGAEKYLEQVLRNAQELSSRSEELEQHIRDWPSEYHLSSKRAQLLSGFQFERNARVLEVGAGCGAITRFLGESFDEVVSVEGSMQRARLARLRTRDLPNVSIICAPFQKIEFTAPFDFIFCIGVYEYSALFIEDAAPHDAALRYFASMLKPDGALVVAIENQFGLKYFTSASEDHVGVMFEGLTGYHAAHGRVRTFGRNELRADLEKHFAAVEFFYPYPDYKMPDRVLSEEFLSSERAGELVSQSRSRDYRGPRPPLWDESLAVLELARNGMLPLLANSFLVFAARSELRRVSFGAQAVMFPPRPRGRFRSMARIERSDDGAWVVRKTSPHGDAIDGGPVKWVATTSRWIDAHSIATDVFGLCQRRNATLESIFEPCRPWARLLKDVSVEERGTRYVGGEYLDCIWTNAYAHDGTCEIVDLEWVWGERLRLNVVAIRAIYLFLQRVGESLFRSPALRQRSGRGLIEDIARTLDLNLSDDDFSEFISIEARLRNIVYGTPERPTRRALRWFLLDWPSLDRYASMRHLARRIAKGVRVRFSRFIGRS
jgi:protein-L-isoaspartate O-methyltransferase